MPQLVSQWVSETVSVESKNECDYELFSRLAGPPAESNSEVPPYRFDSVDSQEQNYLIVKIQEKVFIDEINIHVITMINNGLVKIEAQEDNGEFINEFKKEIINSILR